MIIFNWIIWFFFDWRGRINRVQYFGANVVVFIMSTIVTKTLGPLSLVWFGCYSILILIGAALNAKRLHDMGRSALWILWAGMGLSIWAIGSLYVLIPWDQLVAWKSGHVPPEAAVAFLKGVLWWVAVGVVLPTVIWQGWLLFAVGTPNINQFHHDGQPRLFVAEDFGMSGAGHIESSFAEMTISPRLATVPAIGGSAPRKTFGRRGL